MNPTTPQPTCDMTHECAEPLAYIDDKGYAYCTAHGQNRQTSHRCRKLRPHELKRILSGQPLKKY